MTKESGPKDVREAILALKDEHRQIMGLVERVVATRSNDELVPLLEDLHSVLMGHFAHEEYPDGLYHTMGACTAEHRADLRRLVDEHFAILSTLRGMIERAKDPSAPTLDSAAQELAERLRAHETKEHELAAKLSAA